MFTVLKIIGIIILIILGIIVFILLNLLMIPIRYKFDGRFYDEAYLDAKVSFLPLFLKASVLYNEGKFSYVVKLLGGVVMTNTNQKISWLGRWLFSEKEEEPSGERESDIPKDETTDWDTIKPQQYSDKQTDKDDFVKSETKLDKVDSVKSETKPKENRFAQKIKQLKEKANQIIRNLKSINQKKEQLLRVYHSKRFAMAKKDVFLYLKKFLTIIKPKKLSGKVHFGFDDPALTGEVLGILSVFLFLYDPFLIVEPDFETPCVDGYLKGEGTIRLGSVVSLAIKALFNKNLIKVIKKVQTILES